MLFIKSHFDRATSRTRNFAFDENLKMCFPATQCQPKIESTLG
jgi:hypothetical protein